MATSTSLASFEARASPYGSLTEVQKQERERRRRLAAAVDESSEITWLERVSVRAPTYYQYTKRVTLFSGLVRVASADLGD